MDSYVPVWRTGQTGGISGGIGGILSRM